MPTAISDLHIARADPLPEPQLLRAELPAGKAEAAFIAASRKATRRIRAPFTSLHRRSNTPSGCASWARAWTMRCCW